MRVPSRYGNGFYRVAAFLLCITIFTSSLVALSERAALSAPLDRFTTQFLAQYFDTNLINASEVSGSTSSTDLFDVNNASKLWYHIVYSSKAAQVSVRNQGDLFDRATMQFGLIAPPTDTPFGCYCLSSVHTVPLQAAFTGPNQVVRFTVDPFDKTAVEFDIIDLILELVSSYEHMPLTGLASHIQDVITKLESLPDYEATITAFTNFLRSAGQKDAAQAKDFLLQVAKYLLNWFRTSDIAKQLTGILDEAVGNVFSIGGDAGGPVSIFTKMLSAINGVIAWLQNTIIAKLVGTYNVLATVVDEALLMGALLGYENAPTVTISTVSLGPSSGSSKVPPSPSSSGGGTTTTNPPTSTDNSTWVSNSSPITVQPSQQFSLQFTFTNTGNTTWTDGGGYALDCDTYYHGGGNSSCMGGSSVGLGGQAIAPRQQHSFQFSLTAPSSPGVYQSWWDMAHHGSIFGSNNAYVQVTVQQPSAALVDNDQWIAQSAYPTVNPGQVFSIYFTFQNTGNTMWSDGGGYQLGCDTFYTPTSNCMGAGPVGFGGQIVTPGQQHQFWITLTAPTSAGTYTTAWDLRHNGGIFGNNHVYVTVTVQAPQPQWNSWYAVHRPACDDNSAWADVNHAATRDCSSGSSLVLSQYSNTSWAELDLNTPYGNQYYTQNELRVETQAGFLDPGNRSVWATLVVQTPYGGACGGFLFAVNSLGDWMLQQTSSACTISKLRSGQVGINNGSFNMQVTVQNGQLAAAINGQQVVSGIGDGLNPSPGAEGLMEESSVATSSAILFSSFEIDHWS